MNSVIQIKNLLASISSLEKSDSSEVFVTNTDIFYQCSEFLIKIPVPEGSDVPCGTYNLHDFYNALKPFVEDKIDCSEKDGYLVLSDSDLAIRLSRVANTDTLNKGLFSSKETSSTKLDGGFFQQLKILHNSLGNTFSRGICENLWFEEGCVWGYNGALLCGFSLPLKTESKLVFPRQLIKKVSPLFVETEGVLSECQDILIYKEKDSKRVLLFPKTVMTNLSYKDLLDEDFSRSDWFPTPELFGRLHVLLSALAEKKSDKVILTLKDRKFSISSSKDFKVPFDIHQTVSAKCQFSGVLDSEVLRDLSPYTFFSRFSSHKNVLAFKNAGLQFYFSLGNLSD